jgi:toxin CcdB
MKQFDIFANPFPRSRERQPFLVALQSDLLARSLDTVVVAPLEAADSGGKYADRLNPRVNVEEKSFTLIAQEIVTVRKSVLGGACGSLAHERDHIIAALDLLLAGF